MPLVATKSIEVPTDEGNTEFKTIRINFNQKIGGFFIKIQKLWIVYFTQEERMELGIHLEKNWGFNDFIMLDDKFDDLLGRFTRFIAKSIEKIQKTKREKVLIVDFETEGLTEIHDEDGGLSTHFSKGSPWNDFDKTRMTFSYKAGYRCGEVYFSENMNTLSKYSTENSFILKWTEQREAFFFQIHEGFHGMITKITEFLKEVTETPKTLDAYIESGVKLLPPVSKGKEKP